jgi:hypothetical protein
MNVLRSLDVFQKISVDNLTKPTLIGSLLSLSAIGIMLFLLIRELLDLFTPAITRNSDVIQDTEIHEKINVNLSVNIPFVPCNLISVDQEDSIGNHRLDISDTLHKFNMEANGSISNYDSSKNNLDKMQEAISANRGCKVEGFIPISKVPGDIHISFHNYGIYYSMLREGRRDLFDKIKMSHRINYLYFGDVSKDESLLSRFGYYSNNNNNNDNNSQNSFDQNKNLPNFTHENTRHNYDYYVKLIAHYLVDTNKQSNLGYQFSMTSRKRDFDPDAEGMPIIVINYDLSPISMVIKRENKSFMHFLTHVCAIVGGVYVIFSILNRTLVSFFDSKE